MAERDELAQDARIAALECKVDIMMDQDLYSIIKPAIRRDMRKRAGDLLFYGILQLIGKAADNTCKGIIWVVLTPDRAIKWISKRSGKRRRIIDAEMEKRLEAEVEARVEARLAEERHTFAGTAPPPEEPEPLFQGAAAADAVAGDITVSDVAACNELGKE